MNRRELLILTAGLGLGAALPALAEDAGAAGAVHPEAAMPEIPHDHPLQSSWQAWKALCLAPEGRIIDAFQNAASHSEGQGYGLTLAAIFGDTEAADRIIGWTEANLAVRRDGLLGWRWQEDSTPHVADRNNASDGDLFYAWGLLLLARLNPARTDLRDRAVQIAKALDRVCVVNHPDGSGRPVLLPGADGFMRADGVIVNPSYYMPRALRELAALSGVIRLSQLADAGEQLAESLAASGAVPDWLLLTATGTAPPPAPFSAVSGYEAVRVPLFALWSGKGETVTLRRYHEVMGSAGQQGGTPTVIEPKALRVFERSRHAGYAAVAALAECVTSGSIGSSIPVFSSDQPYYPATLHLMTLVTQVTVYPRCIPL